MDTCRVPGVNHHGPDPAPKGYLPETFRNVEARHPNGTGLLNKADAKNRESENPEEISLLSGREARKTGEGTFELLPVENGFGLTRLPEPSEGDIFFDLEGNSFVGEHGLEYLFGCLFIGETGEGAYRSEWAFSRAEEKQAFESFVDFVKARWDQFPSMHIYHYAPYEPSALKHLMGRYATREEEIDQMLRAGLFVDLYQVVRRGIRASVESYSIKRLEPFYGFERETLLTEANAALANLHANLELDGMRSIADETARSDAENATERLVRAFGDVEHGIREEALEGLILLGGPAIPALLRGLENTDTDLAAGCAEALRQLQPLAPEVLARLTHQLDSTSSLWAVWLEHDWRGRRSPRSPVVDH